MNLTIEVVGLTREGGIPPDVQENALTSIMTSTFLDRLTDILAMHEIDSERIVVRYRETDDSILLEDLKRLLYQSDSCVAYEDVPILMQLFRKHAQ